MSTEGATTYGNGLEVMMEELIGLFPDALAGPLLSVWGRERPNIYAYYLELDQRIQKLIQDLLSSLGHSQVSVISNAHDSDSSFEFNYRYLLTDTTGAIQSFYGIYYELAHSLSNLGIECAGLPDEGMIFINLLPNNRMTVAKPRNPRG